MPLIGPITLHTEPNPSVGGGRRSLFGFWIGGFSGGSTPHGGYRSRFGSWVGGLSSAGQAPNAGYRSKFGSWLGGLSGGTTTPPPVITPTTPVTPTSGPSGGRRRPLYRAVRAPRRPKELDKLETYLVQLRAQVAEVEAAKETQRTIARAEFLKVQIRETLDRRRSLEAEFSERMQEYAAYMAEQDDEETILLMM